MQWPHLLLDQVQLVSRHFHKQKNLKPLKVGMQIPCVIFVGDLGCLLIGDTVARLKVSICVPLPLLMSAHEG